MRDPALRNALVLHVAIVLALVGGLSTAGFSPFAGETEPWWTAFLVANLGILAGNVAMLGLGARAPDARDVVAEGRRQDLEDSRRIVVEQLRQLEAERDKLTPEDYARERAELLAVGTGAMRALEEGAWDAWPSTGPDGGPSSTSDAGQRTAPGTAPVTVVGTAEALYARLRIERDADPAAFDAALRRLGVGSGPSGEWRGAVYTLVLLGLIALLGWLASDAAKQRAPGGTITGGESIGGMEAPPPPPPPSAPPPSPREQELTARVAAQPDDLAAWNELTELALAREDRTGAMRANERALALDAKDPDARVFRGVLLAFIDQVPKAWAEIDAVIAEKPDHTRALVYRGLLSLRLDPAKAVEVLEKANALEPTPQVQAILAEARRRLAAGGDASAPAAPSGAELLAEGTLTLADPSASGQKVFVSLRDPAGGPPLAALVLDPGPFPMTFRVTGANRVAMGGARPMPPVVLVTARLDSDGDALSRPATDPSASREVNVGATGLDLVLGAAP